MSHTLDADQIKALGVSGEWTCGLDDFVRYGDLDTFNHVNNKVYHAWFENIRVLLLQKLELNFDNTDGLKTVVRTASVEFIAPMFLNQVYVVVCKPTRLGKSSFDIEYGVWCDGQFSATGLTTLVMVNAQATASVTIPNDIRQLMIEEHGAKNG